MVAWALKYESAGFDSLWQAELTNSALIQLATLAPGLGSIKIRSGVPLVFNHNPVMLAFLAMDLDFLSQGEFILGLGVAYQNCNKNWYAGRDEGKPLRQKCGSILKSWTSALPSCPASAHAFMIRSSSPMDFPRRLNRSASCCARQTQTLSLS